MRLGLRRDGNGRGMKSIAVVVMALGLVSCGPNGGLAQEQEKGKQVVVQIEVVPDSEIPTDGSIHVSKRGEFDIQPTTQFCTFRPGSGFDGAMLRDALKALGQSDYLDGSPRTNGDFGPDRPSADCSGVNPVLIRVFQTENRNGKPYRLTLVIRQGDAFWQGIVERAGGQRPDIKEFPPLRVGVDKLTSMSVISDSNDLSLSYINYLIEGVVK
jgi:hypothetical protein